MIGQELEMGAYHFTLDHEVQSMQNLHMDENGTWRLTWHQLDNVAWSTVHRIKHIHKRWVECKTRGCEQVIHQIISNI